MRTRSESKLRDKIKEVNDRMKSTELNLAKLVYSMLSCKEEMATFFLERKVRRNDTYDDAIASPTDKVSSIICLNESLSPKRQNSL